MPSAKHFSAGPPRRIVLMLGAPGSGKGTQSSWLSRRLGMPILSTGEILRAESRRNSPAGFRLRQTLASGALVSDSVVCAVVAERLRRELLRSGAILDGFPRTLAQARFLDGLLEENGLQRPVVIHLDISREGLLRRLTGRRQCAVCGAVYNLLTRPSPRGSRCENDGGALVQRDDDTEEVILRRFEEFEKNSDPLIAYYKGTGYHRIAADGEQDVIAEQILAGLGAFPHPGREYRGAFQAA